MKPISPVLPTPDCKEVTLGAGQPEYFPLPAVFIDAVGSPVLTRWELTDYERALITGGADVVITQLTFGAAFQPVHLQVILRHEMPVLINVEIVPKTTEI